MSAPHLSKTMKERDDLLLQVKNLESELKMALSASEDIRALKAKLKALVEQLRIEKERRLDEISKINKLDRKCLSYADHVETLLVNFRLVSRAKVRMGIREKRTRKRNSQLYKENVKLKKMITNKDRLINELRDSSKLLFGQMKLMDERLMYSRSQLDNARHAQSRVVDKSEKEAQRLRTKFAQITGIGIDDQNVDQLSNKFQTLIMLEKNPDMLATLSPTLSPGKVRPKTTPGRKLKRAQTTGGFHDVPSEHETFVYGVTQLPTANSPTSKDDQSAMEYSLPKMSEKKLKQVLDKVETRKLRNQGRSKTLTESEIREMAMSPVEKDKAKSRSRPKTAKL